MGCWVALKRLVESWKRESRDVFSLVRNGPVWNALTARVRRQQVLVEVNQCVNAGRAKFVDYFL